MDINKFLALCLAVSKEAVIPSEMLVKYDGSYYIPQGVILSYEGGVAVKKGILKDTRANSQLIVLLDRIVYEGGE